VVVVVVVGSGVVVGVGVVVVVVGVGVAVVVFGRGGGTAIVTPLRPMHSPSWTANMAVQTVIESPRWGKQTLSYSIQKSQQGLKIPPMLFNVFAYDIQYMS